MNYSPEQQSGPHFASPIAPPGPPKPPTSTAGKWLIVSGLLFGTVLLTLTGTCFYFIAVRPEDRVMTGPQMPARYTAQIRALGILDPDERIDFFSSDAFSNIEEGFYLLTDRNVVIYSRSAEVPAILVPFNKIVEIEADFSSDWMSDTWITLTLTNATYVSFPVSAEAGGDRRMYDALKNRWDAAQALPVPDGPSDDNTTYDIDDKADRDDETDPAP